VPEGFDGTSGALGGARAQASGHAARIEAVVARLSSVLDGLDAHDANRYFLETYLRTTVAVGEAVASEAFVDPDWVERWDVAFAELYLDALEAYRTGAEPPEPWAIAFAVAAHQPQLAPLRHVLLGINAHINYDLPQALLAVMSDEDFADPAVRSRRARDHAAVDAVLSARVGAEDAELVRASAGRTLLDRALTPLNQLGTQRFLREAREKVWANAQALAAARRAGDQELKVRLAELSSLSAAKLEELTAPGQVLLKLARRGFGVRLEGASGAERARRRLRHRAFDPHRVGTLERDAWVDYYLHRWGRLLIVSVALVRAAYGMGPVRTLAGAWHVLRANQLWAPYPDNDPLGARAHMERFYRLLVKAGADEIDPQVAARLELEWWRVHRLLQRAPDAGGTTEAHLVDALAALYAHVFAVDPEKVRDAAAERAAAMVVSDRWVAEGCAPHSPDLGQEKAALVRSYAALLAAVHC
jgi:Family of unknown function (DUF5995)